MKPAPLALALVLAALAGAAAADSVTWRWVDAAGVVHYSDQPPPPGAQQVEQVRLSSGRADAVPGYATRKAAEDFPVTLYTAENCVELCAKARDFLVARGIPFTERIMRSEEDLAEFRRVFGPPDEVPAATVGRQPLRGFEAGAWQRLLDDVGYPRTDRPR